MTGRTIPGGLLIAVEGIDGAGKSTQARAVGEALADRGLDCVLTHEPTRGPWGRIIRQSAASGRLAPADELHAFLEDRKQHVRELIRPSLEAGRIVITDRYYFSTVAYQGARGFDPVELLRTNEAIAIEPHLLVLIDIDPAAGLIRIGTRDGAANQFESIAQLTRSREIFLALDKPYLLRLDGTAPPNDLRDRILFAAARTVLTRLDQNLSLTPSERLAAALALHGAAGGPPG
jgi:dTMP kinase